MPPKQPKPNEFVGTNEFSVAPHPAWKVPPLGDDWLYGAVLQHMACTPMLDYIKANSPVWGVTRLAHLIESERSHVSNYIHGQRWVPINDLGRMFAAMNGTGLRGPIEVRDELQRAFDAASKAAKAARRPPPLLSDPSKMGLQRSGIRWADSPDMADDTASPLEGIETTVRADLETALHKIHSEVSEPDWIPGISYEVLVDLFDGDERLVDPSKAIGGQVIDSQVVCDFYVTRQWVADVATIGRTLIDGQFITSLIRPPDRVMALRALPSNYLNDIPLNWYLTGSPATINRTDPDHLTLDWDHETLGAAAVAAREIGFTLHQVTSDTTPWDPV